MPDLTVKQAADQLLMTGYSVRLKIHAGELDAHRNEMGDWRISPEAVARYREARKTKKHGMARYWERVRELQRAAASAA